MVFLVSISFEKVQLQYLFCLYLRFPAEGITSDLAPVEDEEEENKERHCDSLIMCIVTTLNEGLRNGGGIGDVLRKPSRTVGPVLH